MPWFGDDDTVQSNDMAVFVREIPRYYIEIQHTYSTAKKCIDKNEVKQAIDQTIGDIRMRNVELVTNDYQGYNRLNIIRKREGRRDITVSFTLNEKRGVKKFVDWISNYHVLSLKGKRMNERMKLLHCYQICNQKTVSTSHGFYMYRCKSFMDIDILLGRNSERNFKRMHKKPDHFWIKYHHHPLNYKPPPEEVVDNETGENRKQKNFRRNKTKRDKKRMKRGIKNVDFSS